MEGTFSISRIEWILKCICDYQIDYSIEIAFIAAKHCNVILHMDENFVAGDSEM